jgi:ribonuclease HII
MSAHPAGLRVGVDENGLGPRLGPMIVTGALLDVGCDAGEFARAANAVGIGDSKGLCAHGAMRDVEATVLALLDAHLGLRPESFAALFEALCLDTHDALRGLCPDGEAPRMCFDADVALPAFGGAPGPRHRDGARALRDAGAAVRAVRFTSVCNRRLHAEQALGRSRFDVDLARMVDLVRALRGDAGAAVTAVCGKVGGRKRYADALGALSPLVAIEEEVAARSAYRVPGVGSVAFVRDADATDPAVGLASLVGKYVRELSMRRIHLDLRAHVPDLGEASGYHDPVTTRYIAATALVRRERGIPDPCFER